MRMVPRHDVQTKEHLMKARTWINRVASECVYFNLFVAGERHS